MYEIEFGESASRQLKELKANERALLIARIEKQLATEPLKVTRKSQTACMNPTFLKLIRRARAEVRRGKVVSLREVRKQFAEAAAPDRALPRTR